MIDSLLARAEYWGLITWKLLDTGQIPSLSHIRYSGRLKKTLWENVSTYPDVCGHLICADFSAVAAEHAVVEAVEEEHDAHVHPDVRLDVEHEVEAEERGHHDGVADDAQAVADFVQQQEPLIHQPVDGRAERHKLHLVGRDWPACQLVNGQWSLRLSDRSAMAIAKNNNTNLC